MLYESIVIEAMNGSTAWNKGMCITSDCDLILWNMCDIKTVQEAFRQLQNPVNFFGDWETSMANCELKFMQMYK